MVQLFSDVVHLDPDDHEEPAARVNGHASVPGVASLPNARALLSLGRQEKQALKVRFNPGLAWAAKRALLEDHGFYDAAIVGGGDSLMVSAMYGEAEALAERFVLDQVRRRHFQKWAVPFHRSVAGRIGHVSGTACHLKHGEPENRAYYERQDRLAEFSFDPDADLMIGA